MGSPSLAFSMIPPAIAGVSPCPRRRTWPAGAGLSAFHPGAVESGSLEQGLSLSG